MSGFLMFIDAFIVSNPYLESLLSFLSGFVLICAVFYGIIALRQEYMLRKKSEELIERMLEEEQRMRIALLTGEKIAS